MEMYALTQEQITAYGQYLRGEEHAPGTIEKYLRDTGLLPHGWRAAG